jgi:hypothetical protein
MIYLCIMYNEHLKEKSVCVFLQQNGGGGGDGGMKYLRESNHHENKINIHTPAKRRHIFLQTTIN